MSSLVKRRRQGPCSCCLGDHTSRCHPGWRERAERREAQRDLDVAQWWPAWRRDDGGGFWGEDDYDPNEHQTWVQFINGQMVVVDGPCGCVDCQQKNKEAA